MGIVLVTGPARSGKSEWAENLALKSNNCVIYLATALVNLEDLDWVERLSKHQKRRPEHWLTWEVPELQLISAIATSPASSCLLVDSLGTWVAALLDKDATQWEQIVQELLLTLRDRCNQEIIFVAEETGWGVVPAYPSGRTFRDRLGNLVRRIGAISDSVYLVTGGYALNLTTLGSPLISSQD
ncbi:bifunctional adenosylcobinamide kinase/adenosylcobinamide-phosphate guanylyltransferase [Chlorogloea sp. CCALA 695]|uniref:bifunctional adenosylcobinamide kinase/adenosylcobinamide-phosphate guanylyltransferase n=1 Tax=Chlorogloea sp. CCALA 695 TaxID=2107693 RepID=UPI000D0777A7|nr:bifunctional adenosylcobinamide kinase/adenosylcobinamide-phosphate guanylyltransferase [Chlorogloea sp. CCALA 695]PSB33201.1 bifunctional adenosylcobinamide kinase/adenosylcobinamide-phosphate guanylyltransferase [Chlorogloea sp. CCALA 695]